MMDRYSPAELVERTDRRSARLLGGDLPCGRRAAARLGPPLLAAVMALTCSDKALASSSPLCVPHASKLVTASSSGSLDEALAEVACGSTVILPSGTYDGRAEVRADCPDGKPAIIRAEDLHEAQLTGTLRLLGRNLVVEGLSVDGGRIEVRGATNRVTRNLFRTGGGLVVGATADSRIDHNEFATPAGPGTDMAFKFSKSDKRPARAIRVDHNLFTSSGSGAAGKDDDEEDDDRGSVGIYLGQFSARKGRQDMLNYGKVGVVVEQNIFKDYHRRKAIHVKSLGNTIRNNIFIATANFNHWSQVTIRSGQFNEINDNLMDGTTGLQIFEEHNRAAGNILTNGATLVVMGGGGEMTQFAGPQQREAADTSLEGNVGPLVIGATYERRSNKTPATNTVVEGHDGPIERLLEQGTVIRTNAVRRAAGAIRLDEKDVGPAAPDADCPAS